MGAAGAGDETVLVVDGNAIVHRAFHSQARTGARTADGRPIWAVRGLLSQLVAAVERVGPDRVVVGFDDPAASVRRERWPQYKAQRAEKLPALVEQLETAAHALRRLGVEVVVPAGLEADDVLASVAHRVREAGGQTVVATSDRDAFGLIDERTRVLRIINGGVEASPMLTPQRLEMMLGVRPVQYRDFAALRGDPSDNLPGVRGIGPRTAARLLAEFGTARAVFDEIADGGERVSATVGKAATGRLRDPGARANWELNCRVMTMHTDVDVDLAGPAGVLPLPAADVASAFTAFDLVWTTPAALRALAHDETGGGTAPVPPDRVEPSWWPGPPRPARHRPLPARPRPARDDQLALF